MGLTSPCTPSRAGVGCTLRGGGARDPPPRTPLQPSRRAALGPCRLLIVPIQWIITRHLLQCLHDRVLPGDAWYHWLKAGVPSIQVCRRAPAPHHDQTVRAPTSRARRSCPPLRGTARLGLVLSQSRSYGSILPTSLIYIVLSTRGCSPWRPDAVMSTNWHDRYPLPQLFKGRQWRAGHHQRRGAFPAAGPYLRMIRFQGLRAVKKKRELFPGPLPTSSGSLTLPSAAVSR